MFGLHPGDGMWSWWLSGWGVVWCLVAVAMIVAVVVWLASRPGNSTPDTADRVRVDALRILEGRLARGEIDQAEFDARRAVLLCDREA